MNRVLAATAAVVAVAAVAAVAAATQRALALRCTLVFSTYVVPAASLVKVAVRRHVNREADERACAATVDYVRFDRVDVRAEFSLGQLR